MEHLIDSIEAVQKRTNELKKNAKEEPTKEIAGGE